MASCWICGSTATTAEHKFKHSDLQRVHGKGDLFSRANLNYLKSSGIVVPLQGPNSDHVKYKNVLCAKCNNQITQPYDKAYDTFVGFIESNRDLLITRREIDFAQIYGLEWRIAQLNLHKYFVKAFGCRISNAGADVPPAFQQMLADQQPEQGVTVCFAINERELIKPEAEQCTLRIGDLKHNLPASYLRRYVTSSFYRWLVISYWYNWEPDSSAGEPWFQERQILCMGSYSEV